MALFARRQNCTIGLLNQLAEIVEGEGINKRAVQTGQV